MILVPDHTAATAVLELKSEQLFSLHSGVLETSRKDQALQPGVSLHCMNK